LRCLESPDRREKWRGGVAQQRFAHSEAARKISKNTTERVSKCELKERKRGSKRRKPTPHPHFWAKKAETGEKKRKPIWVKAPPTEKRRRAVSCRQPYTSRRRRRRIESSTPERCSGGAGTSKGLLLCFDLFLGNWDYQGTDVNKEMASGERGFCPGFTGKKFSGPEKKENERKKRGDRTQSRTVSVPCLFGRELSRMAQEKAALSHLPKRRRKLANFQPVVDFQ